MTLSEGEWRARRIVFFVAWLFVAGLVAGSLAQTRVLQTIDQYLQDGLTRIQAPVAAPEGITLIDIDERSLQELGPWPWPRPVLAQISHALRERGARLQVWDLALPHEAPGDALLARELAHPDVVIGQIAVLDPQVESPPREGLLQHAPQAPDLCSRHTPITGHLGLSPSLSVTQVGHLSATPDPDGLLRRIPAVICYQSHRYPQLALAAAIAATPDQPWHATPGTWPLGPHQWLSRGPWRFALDADGYLPVHYQRPNSAWPAISASRLLDPAAALPSLNGHIVLIGGSAMGLGDVVSTPYHPSAPGVSVHAELLAAAQNAQAWPGAMPRGNTVLAALLAILVGWAMLPLGKTQLRLLWLCLGITLGMCAPWVAAVLVRSQGVMLPVAAPSLTLLAHGLALLVWQTQQQRQNTKRLARHLESFLPPTLAHQVATQTPSGQSLGHPCDGVLVAVRIAGMDRWVSQVDSLQALALIHALHTAGQHSATLHGGSLEHAQGSTLYLTWPQSTPQALAAALSSVRHLQALLMPALMQNETLTHPLSTYAAIEAGAYLLGIVGESGSRRSVLLGPVANDVMGMLSLGEELASPILIGPKAAQAFADGAAALQPLGRFLLPDQLQAKHLYRSAP